MWVSILLPRRDLGNNTSYLMKLREHAATPLPQVHAGQGGPQCQEKGPSWHKCDSQGMGSLSGPDRWLTH